MLWYQIKLITFISVHTLVLSYILLNSERNSTWRNLSILVTAIIGIFLFYFVLYYSFDYVVRAIDIEAREKDSEHRKYRVG